MTTIIFWWHTFSSFISKITFPFGTLFSEWNDFWPSSCFGNFTTKQRMRGLEETRGGGTQEWEGWINYLRRIYFLMTLGFLQGLSKCVISEHKKHISFYFTKTCDFGFRKWRVWIAHGGTQWHDIFFYNLKNHISLVYSVNDEMIFDLLGNFPSKDPLRFPERGFG